MPVYSGRIKEWREELEKLTRVLTNAHGVRLGKGMIKEPGRLMDTPNPVTATITEHADFYSEWYGLEDGTLLPLDDPSGEFWRK